MLDRTIAPEVRFDMDLSLPPCEEKTLPNGVKLYIHKGCPFDLTRVRVVVDGGGIIEAGRSAITHLLSLLCDKTNIELTGEDMAEQIDQLGAVFGVEHGTHNVYFSFECITANVRKMCHLLRLSLEGLNFRDDELDSVKPRLEGYYSYIKTNPSSIARIAFLNHLVGKQYPDAQKGSAEEVSNLSRDEIMDYIRKNIINKRIVVYATGCVNDEVISAIEDTFGNKKEWGQNNFNRITIPLVEEPNAGIEIIHLPNATQTTIIMGKRLCNTDSKDLYGLQILSVILGGYFGSRLNINIRETKGYTYGISSSVPICDSTALFQISTQCNAKYANDVIGEICKELQALIDTEVPEDEFDTVIKNLKTSVAAKVDSSFNAAMLHNSIRLGYTNHEEYIKVLSTITTKEIKLLAAKYFEPSSMHIVVVSNDANLQISK